MLEAHRSTLGNVALDERAQLDGAQDLVALKSPANVDVLSKTLRSHWPFPSAVSNDRGEVITCSCDNSSSQQAPPSHQPDKISYFQERHLVQLISALSMFIAAILIIGPILALNFTSNPSARLGIAITFIVLFAMGLGLSTGVSRDNIFVATATYSAVLVVFVSGNLGDVGDSGGSCRCVWNATSSP